ncbi:MAG TPA: hypothetical protein VEX68_17250 [Bryobacteraceae bacterium]|nr:hypothetical protein [Bryobacteraceae bacterium]
MRQVLIAISALLSLSIGASSQNPQHAASDFGGNYDSLQPEQRALIDDWMKRFSATIHKQVDPQQAYNNLSLSTRTTFNAVTHALISMQLTGESGRKLGSAIQIIEKLETVRGEVLGTRGDEQFRVYIQLKPGALNLLDQSQEFRRTEDNTVYHKGYPICYRSKPSVPSIQVSATRDKTKADVDVDYKSSGIPKALLNGHLSASNSDVRAGRNDEIHNSQWRGLNNWWRNVLSLPRETKKDVYAEAGGATADGKAQAKMKPAEAVHDLLNTWLVEQKPENVISYFARQSFACADLEAGEKLDRGMAPFRLLMALQRANQRFGKLSQVGDILTAVSPAHGSERTKQVQHPYQDQFALYDIREDAAEQFRCVNRPDPSQTSPKAAASKSFGKFYGAVFRIGKKDGAEATTLATLWTRESKNFWRLISYDVDPMWDEYRVPNTATIAPPTALTEYTTAPDDLIDGATKFLMAWFVKQDLKEASRYLSAKCAECLKLNREPEQPEPKTAEDAQAELKKAMQSILEPTGMVKALEEAIVAPGTNHEDIMLVKHARSKAFVLASIPDYMGDALDCDVRTPGEPVSFRPPASAKSYGKYYVTGFRLAKTGEDSGVFWAVWTREGSAWKLTAYTALTP